MFIIALLSVLTLNICGATKCTKYKACQIGDQQKCSNYTICPPQDTTVNDYVMGSLIRLNQTVLELGAKLKHLEDKIAAEEQISPKRNKDATFDYTICYTHRDVTGVLELTKSELLQVGWIGSTVRNCENGWTIIQQRGFNGQENFTRSWYKMGFGKLTEDFWYGNDLIHLLSYLHNLKLRIELESFEGEKVYAEYDTFKVEHELNDYRLIIDGYSGDASDSLSYHNNTQFSTYDRPNGQIGQKTKKPCAEFFKSGWWFNSCLASNLNGVYYDTTPNNFTDGYGIQWRGWMVNVPLKRTKMMVRPKP